MFDRDEIFVDSDLWDDGDRAYDKWVDQVASGADFDPFDIPINERIPDEDKLEWEEIEW